VAQYGNAAGASAWRSALRSDGEVQRPHAAHRHHHHVHGGAGWRAAQSRAEPPGGASYAEVRLRVRQTVDAVAARPAAATQAAADSGDTGIAATGTDTTSVSFEARLRVRIQDDRVDARLKLDIHSESDPADFTQALENFTAALYDALRTLFGGAQGSRPAALPAAAAPAAALPAPAVAADAAADAAGGAAAIEAAEAPQAAPAGASVGPTLQPTPVPQPSASSTPETAQQVATADPATEAAAPVEAATPATGSTHVSLRLRIAYGGFENSLGSLTLRLSAGASGSQQAGGAAAAFGSLLAPFAELADVRGLDGSASGLSQFLRSLASAFDSPAQLQSVATPTLLDAAASRPALAVA
jgi:hypothetical protein